ncbi:MAG TPA: NAD-dependent epimerase/dehydratase family protein [Candidatus Kapabacteria bacterium]|nr:NAD-dependent epimerase/dehydratase family protein [Candidatus Kapabacteria bacterium]
MKIFLTGGNGFIGRNIQEQLGHTYEIFAPKREELDLTDSDAVYAYLKNHPVDVVIHAANVGGTRKQQHVFGTSHVNLKIFFNLVRAKPFYTRMITLGSGAEYDKMYPVVQVKETDFGSHVPSDEYGLYKYVCAEYATKVDYITHLRLFAVFGKYEDYEIRFISNAICRALLHLPVTMRQNVKFDYLFIDDFIRILDAFIKNKPKETCINVGRGEPMDLKTIAELVIREVGNNVEILVANKGWGNEYSCDVSRLHTEIPQLVYTPFDIAISKLVAYYRTSLPNLPVSGLTRE